MVRTVPFIERRRFPRLTADGTALAVSADAEETASVSKLNLSDLSDGGLSARSSIAMPVASPVTVILPTDASVFHTRLSRIGRVVRCYPTGGGYHVAVAFDVPAVVA